MKVLVVYDSVSPTRMTEKVAQAVVAAMREKGVSVESYFVDDAKNVSINDFDCLIVGAPTMAWRPSEKMKSFLSSLQGTNYSGKMAAAFDTQVKSFASGNAAKHMEESLSGLGFKIVSPALISYVKSENKQYQLREGEAEKAKAWGYDLARILSK